MDDLRFFCAWFEEIQNKKINWLKIKSFDLQTYRQYLVKARRQKVAAVNRRVQALKRFFDWVYGQSLIKGENQICILQHN